MVCNREELRTVVRALNKINTYMMDVRI